MEGMIIIDKPIGLSSFDIIRQLRRCLKTRSLGHSGTLDPLATGVLCVCVGWAVKLLRFLDDDSKEYRAVARLGQVTETDDAEGRVIREHPVCLEPGEVETALSSFLGTIQQQPPIYSAIKKSGTRAYEAARRGEVVEMEYRPVRIDSITLESLDGNLVTFRVTCGKGTYIRSLGRDLGEKLGCGAHLVALRRLRSGTARVEQASTVEAIAAMLERGDPIPLTSPLDMLIDLPLVEITADEADGIEHGQWIDAPMDLDFHEDGFCRLSVKDSTRLLAVALMVMGKRGPLLRPVKVRPSRG